MFYCQRLLWSGLFHHTIVPFDKLNEIWSHAINCMNVIVGNEG